MVGKNVSAFISKRDEVLGVRQLAAAFERGEKFMHRG
jgi:hypothetical protein